MEKTQFSVNSALNIFCSVSVLGEGMNYVENVYIGLAAVAGFLVVVFIATMSNKMLKKKHKKKR